MWPELPYNDWIKTYDTLHMWTQIVGKVALKLNPVINHWWECSLRVSTRGLRTTLIPFKEHSFEVEFNFIEHKLIVSKSDGSMKSMDLKDGKSVADFYSEFMGCLNALGIKLEIDMIPSEFPNPIAFDKDQVHKTYDPEMALRHWQILVKTDKLLTKFRSRFMGKASPVQFWWGSFDLALSLYSGNRAPVRSGADSITKQAYSHEVMAAGFWPGSGNILEPAFYTYMAPEPGGFKNTKMIPSSAFYNEPSKGFVLKYEDVRKLPNPEEEILSFFNCSYESGISLANWNYNSLTKS